MTHLEKAQELRARTDIHFNCCQSVLIPFARELGLTEEQAYAMGAHFGSGMHCGSACGTVTGALMALGLAGCGTSHPVTKAGEACASCHSDGRAAAASPNLSAAAVTGLTFAIDSSADEVILCSAVVADDEGGTVVPARMRTIPASEFGAVTVSEPGLYALCAGDISSPSATVLVNATEDGPADVTVRV